MQINAYHTYMVPVVKCTTDNHKLKEKRMYSYQFRVTSDLPYLVQIMVPVVVIHHVRERRGHACKCIPIQNDK